jgi:hypothetical protein
LVLLLERLLEVGHPNVETFGIALTMLVLVLVLVQSLQRDLEQALGWALATRKLVWRE